MKNVKDYNKSLNEGKINFNDSPFKKALPIKQVAELIKKASKEDVDKLLKTLTIKQAKDMESMKKGGGSDAGSLAAILTDELFGWREILGSSFIILAGLTEIIFASNVAIKKE